MFIKCSATYLDIHIKRPIPFNNYSDDLDNTIYSVVIEEKPTEVCAYGEYSKYYDLKVGNEHNENGISEK